MTAADAIGIGVVLAGIAVAAPKPAAPRRGDPAVAVFAGCAAAIVALHVALGTRWPVARTAVYLIPTGTLAVALTARRPTPALVAATVVLAAYAAQVPTRCLRYARYDAGSAAVFDAVAADAAARPLARPARLGGSWIYVPALTFYRSARQAEPWLAPIGRPTRPRRPAWTTSSTTRPTTPAWPAST